MKNIKSELIQLMLISEVGAKYTTSEILDYLGMENTNANAKLLKQAMNELEEYYVHKKINITDEDGKRHTLRGYVVISTVLEETEEEPEYDEYDEDGEVLSDEVYEEIIANTKKIAEAHVNQLAYYLLYGCNDVETYEEVKGFAYDDMVALGYY